MKKIILASAVMTFTLVNQPFASSQQDQEDSQWKRTFKFSNGLSITHTPDVLTFDGMGAQKMKGTKFFKGSKLNGFQPSEDGKLNVNMSLITFRSQLAKLGSILSEEEFK